MLVDPLLDALPDGVVFADEAGVIGGINRAAARMLQVPDGPGKHLSDVVALQDRAGNDWYSCAAAYDGARIRSGIPELSLIHISEPTRPY